MSRPLGSQFLLGSRLGSGAMGEVFEGNHVDGRSFAFKLLHPNLAADPDIVTRFMQERTLLTNLRHPNLVGVHELIVDNGTVAVVMDLVRGGDLRAALSEAGTFLPEEVARIGAGIAAALHAVHLEGIVHRDVKPENVLMDAATAPRTPRLTDFGISRAMNSTRVGRSTLLAGTPLYVAPELIDGKEPTYAADLYSLGIVLYELCCGVTPFASHSMLQVMRNHVEMEPGRPEGIPEELWRLISWLLAKGPAGRPQSAAQVAAVLDAMAPTLRGLPVALRLTEPPPGRPIAAGATQLGTHSVATPVQGGPPVKKRRRGRMVFTAVATVAVLGLVGWVALRPFDVVSDTAGEGGGDSTGTATTSAPAVRSTSTSSVAKLTTAPDLVGKPLSEAQEAIPASIKITTVDAIDPSAKDGTVIAQEPKSGDPISDEIKLTVARPVVTVFLDSVKTVSGQWGNVELTNIAGKEYLHAVGTQVYYNCGTGPSSVEYNVSKGFRKLVATAGIDDNAADANTKVQLEFFADGRLVGSNAVALGTPVPVDVDLSGVLRLKIQWQVTAGQRCDSGNFLTLGEAKLLGLASEVPKPSVTATR